MEEIYLKIMLHLSLICSPCSYTEVEISIIYEDNQIEIYEVKSDEVLMEYIIDAYEDEVQGVYIGDPFQKNLVDESIHILKSLLHHV